MREYWLFPWRVVPVVFRLVLRAFEKILLTKGFHQLFWIILWLVVLWHVYVPIHELLHVLGCHLTGGHIEELALKPQYGGHLLGKIFPFVVPDSQYAGQLTGFSTPNDFAYAVVDFLPYLISLPGLALFALAHRKTSPFLFSLATILGLTPACVVVGDFYEAASLLTTRLGPLLDPQLGARQLISDDVFRLLGELNQTGHLGVASLFLVGLGLFLAIGISLFLWVIQLHLAQRWLGGEFLFGGAESEGPQSDTAQIMATSCES